MKEQLAKIRAEAISAFESVKDAAALDELRVRYLGKKGDLTAGAGGAAGGPAGGEPAENPRPIQRPGVRRQP